MNSVRTGTFRSSLLVAIASWVVNVSAGTCDAGWVNPYPRWDSVVDERRLPAVLLVRQRHLVAMLAHPDDDRAEAGPGVEPGVEHGELADHLPLFDE